MILENVTCHSFVVRCWTARASLPDGPSTNRFMVESVSDEVESRNFDTFEALITFLKTELLDTAGLDQRDS